MLAENPRNPVVQYDVGRQKFRLSAISIFPLQTTHFGNDDLATNIDHARQWKMERQDRKIAQLGI